MENPPVHVKYGIKIFGAIIFLVVIFLAGVYIGYENRPPMAKIVDLVHKDTPSAISADTDFASFWKAWEIVDEKFPEASEVGSRDRMYGAIKGLLASFGDPYTTFFPPAENEEFETQISGEFSGVGIEIGQKEGILTVIAPLKGTPAERAGIKAGDKIVKIGDEIATDFNIDKAIKLIRGVSGTNVTLTIVREGVTTPQIFTITRAKITVPTIDTQIREADGVFIISLYNFSAHSVELFRRAYNEYLSSGYKNLIIDLRGNPGGYLDAAVQIAGMFLPEGKVIVKEIGKTDKDVVTHTSRGRGVFPKDHKLIILVDKGSASASEILAGALSEHNVGTLVGTQTFGKGSVQEIVKLTSDTSLKITVAKWFTPNGISISKNGLNPKIIIKQGTKKDVDSQLDEAVKLFSKI